MGIQAVVRGAAGRLDGLLGRSVYQTTVPDGSDIHALCTRLEKSVRTEFEPAGFDVRAVAEHGTWFLLARRGLTSGFMVGLIPAAQGAGMLAGVARSSRLDEWAGVVAGGCGVIAAVLSLLAVAAVGVPLPGVAVAAIVLGVGLIALLVAYQLLIPALSALEAAGGGRLGAARIATVIELVRGVIETDPVSVKPDAKPLSRSGCQASVPSAMPDSTK